MLRIPLHQLAKGRHVARHELVSGDDLPAAVLELRVEERLHDGLLVHRLRGPHVQKGAKGGADGSEGGHELCGGGRVLEGPGAGRQSSKGAVHHGGEVLVAHDVARGGVLAPVGLEVGERLRVAQPCAQRVHRVVALVDAVAPAARDLLDEEHMVRQTAVVDVEELGVVTVLVLGKESADLVCRAVLRIAGGGVWGHIVALGTSRPERVDPLEALENLRDPRLRVSAAEAVAPCS
mmetsp:Transcript_13787/g.40599  ORF Transcript_13787/g.40599 Transcript_13787/m.40599 type:complete len:235 (+) Transcript_13787:384-1088(+)